MVAIANTTGSVVAELGTVPNQPLAFDGDGVPRWEDDLIAYNWARSLTGDGPKRLVLDAMTKSAVRAMDTVTAIMARPEWGERTSSDSWFPAFRSAGGTWLAAAVDERVVGIAPIVFSQPVADYTLHASCRASARRRSTSCCESRIRTNTGIA